MSADVVPFEGKRRGDVEDVVRASIRAVIAGRKMSVDELAADAGMSRSTLHRRLSSKGTKDAFYAGEVAVIAEVLGIEVGDLYTGLGGTFRVDLLHQRSDNLCYLTPLEPLLPPAA